MVFNYNVIKIYIFDDSTCMLNGNVSVLCFRHYCQWQLVNGVAKRTTQQTCVAKADELLLGMDIAEQGDEGEDMVYRTNMGQVNNGEGGEVLAMDVQHLDA